MKVVDTFLVDTVSSCYQLNEIEPGDIVLNITDGEESIVLRVDTSTTIKIYPNTWFYRFLVRFYRFIGYHSR